MLFLLVGIVAAVALAHMVPFPFLLDALHAKRVMWRMPHTGGAPTVYLTFDDGPNPVATPALLDVLAEAQVQATFFLIEHHITEETAPIVRRISDEGHSIALHSHTRREMVRRPEDLAEMLTTFAARVQGLTGRPSCKAFRPHAGWRSTPMLEGLRGSTTR